MGRWRRLGSRLARWLVLAFLVLLLLVVAGAAALQTPWAHERLRALIVSQANRYLTATLEIGRMSGSLFRGIELEDVRLTRDHETIVAIDRLSVSYSIRELVDRGTVIRRLALERPRIVAAKQPDGRWNLAALIRRDTQRARSSGPRRPLHIDRIEIVDGSVTLRDPLAFGAARVPTSFTRLDAAFSLAYEPVSWTLDFERASFSGTGPPLTVVKLSGATGSGSAGWVFRDLHVVTPKSDFTVDGRVDRQQSPTTLDLRVAAPRFAFQEWSGVLRGLTNIAVDAAFDAQLSGPLAAMKTNIALRSNAGDVRGDLVLDTTVPGWNAKGAATVQRLDLAHWLNRPERRSDISGSVGLDLNLQLGGRFPRGAFTFEGPHAAYLGYEADEVVARGTITATDVQITSATATAYGANVRLSAGSRLAIDAPFRFRFAGTARGVDLRWVPPNVPVPHVESTLHFDYDVTGQFTQPHIQGTATFADSVFLGAHLGAGASGFIDTLAVPFHYAGEGDLRDVDLHYFGKQLDIGWLTEPRYEGTMGGHFRVDGTGSDLATMRLEGGGRLEQAQLFGGQLANADVGVSIAYGSLEGHYDGELHRIDPAIAMNDPRYAATLNGRARGDISVRDLLVRSPLLDDYTLDAALDIHDSVVRGLDVSRGETEAALANGAMQIKRLVASGPALDVEATGRLELDDVRDSDVAYTITRSDLLRLAPQLGRDVRGEAVTSGHLRGTLSRPQFAGHGEVTQLVTGNVAAASVTATYDVTFPVADPVKAAGTLTARLDSVEASGQILQSVDTQVTYDGGRTTASVRAVLRDGVTVSADAALVLDPGARQVDVEALAVIAQRTSWRLAAGSRPRVSWDDAGISIAGLDLVDTASGQEHVTVGGDWKTGGGGRLQLAARSVSLEAITEGTRSAGRYGGVVDLTAIVTGTSDAPRIAADFRITRGAIRRLPYDLLAGHADYHDEVVDVDVRLDQAPGVWLTANGQLPLSVFDRRRAPRPMQLAVKSSDVSLTLLEGVTDVVRNVGGQLRLDVTVLGTSHDPHFSGRVELANASFDVVESGARYRNGRVALQLSTDRVGVETLHVEDENGDPLDVTGSLGTHELRVGDLEVNVTARAFQVMRNEYGRVDVDAALNFAGEFESPRMTGQLTVNAGSLNVDRILDRTLFQPYATEPAPAPVDIDPIIALNPWERMGIDIELHVPGTLRMVGENVQVTPGTPLGLGNINLRAFGDLSLYKDPAQPLYVNGSFDSVSGTYAFQGRRFDLDPASSIIFRGDLNPELYVTVNRVISGVETRVSIVGPLREPELRLASTPPLEQSDILSLIVFNTSTNQLSALQQQQLAVRAGTLAAGFLAAPMVAALERTLGIDTIEIEPGTDIRGGPRVTVGNEIAPGLTARFSRQFGEGEYDEATLEYYLSRIFRIRATFSDATALTVRSPFRRVERAGIDLLLFFSF